MVLVVDQNEVQTTLDALKEMGETGYQIGRITKNEEKEVEIC